MPTAKPNYQEVQSLYELCTTGKDLKEFCHESGVNYNKFVAWQRKQLWDSCLGKTREVNPPAMSAVALTELPKDLDSSVPSSSPSVVSSPIRYIQIRLGDGFFIQKYNTSIEEVLKLLTKLEGLSC